MRPEGAQAEAGNHGVTARRARLGRQERQGGGRSKGRGHGKGRSKGRGHGEGRSKGRASGRGGERRRRAAQGHRGGWSRRRGDGAARRERAQGRGRRLAPCPRRGATKERASRRTRTEHAPAGRTGEPTAGQTPRGPSTPGADAAPANRRPACAPLALPPACAPLAMPPACAPPAWALLPADVTSRRIRLA